MRTLYAYYTSLAIMGVAGVVFSLINYSTGELGSSSIIGMLAGIALLSVSVYKARAIEPSDFTVGPYGVFATVLLALLSVSVVLFELIS